jgi:hypothetical protein
MRFLVGVLVLLAACGGEPLNVSPSVDMAPGACHLAPLPPADMAGVTWHDADGGACGGGQGEPCCGAPGADACDPSMGVICTTGVSGARICAWAARPCL